MTSVVDRDLRCARCGYNLRTLALADVCPECGLAVAESTVSDDLAAAPRVWVRRQLLGVWLQCLSYLLAGVSILAEILRGDVLTLPRPLLMALRVAPLVGLALAVWLLTSPRPYRRSGNATLVVRYGFAAVLVLALLLPGVDHAGFKTTLGRAGWTLFFSLLVICWIGVGCVQVRIARMVGVRGLGAFLWLATIVWSLGLIATAMFYIFREFTEQTLFDRAQPIYVYTLMAGGALIVMSSLVLAITFTLRDRKAIVR